VKNTCPQPGCGAAYDLSGQPVGARFTCKQCGQGLVIESDGLHLAASPPSPPSPPSSSGAARAASMASTVAPEVIDRMQRIADWPTWAFGAGTLIALCALFFPLIDQAKVSRLEAMIVAGDMRQQRVTALAQAEDATADDKADAEDAKKRWATRKNDLEEDVEYAELSRRSYSYWYRYLTLLGFGFLVLGSFGYLDSRQPLMRRVLGCIVLAATVLVVLNALARVSFRFEVGPI